MKQADDKIYLKEFFALILKFIFRNIKIITLNTVLFSALGIYYFTSANKYYETQSVVYSPVLERQVVLEILEPLNTLFLQKNYSALESYLNLPEEDLKQIRELTFAFSKHTTTSHSPEKNDDKFKEMTLVTATVYSNDVISKINPALKYYLEHNDYYKTAADIKLQSELNSQRIIGERLQSPDLEKLQGMDNIDIIYGSDASGLSQTLELSMLIESSIKMNTSLATVSDFYPSSKDASKRLIALILSVFIGFIVGLFLAFAKESYSLLK